jgi:hypothetical protein
MYTLGAFVACVNLITYAMYADTYRRGHWTSNIWKSSAFRSLHVIVVTSIMVMFVAGPILSPYVALRITQKVHLFVSPIFFVSVNPTVDRMGHRMQRLSHSNSTQRQELLGSELLHQYSAILSR